MNYDIKAMLCLAAASVCMAGPGVAFAQFPEKPVRVIMPFPPGVGPDTVMRQVGERLSEKWKQPVIVENRAGGNGWIAAEAVKRAKPDGYTLLLANSPLLALHPHLYSKLPYNPTVDFTPAASVYRTYFFVTTAADAPWNTVSELVAASKAKPEHYTYGTSGYGSDMHVGASMMQNAAGAKWTHIPYKETSQIYVDMSRGDVSWGFGSPATTAAMLAAGKIKYLAIAGPERMKKFPNVPTVRESFDGGGFDLQTSVLLMAPAGTPADIVQTINEAVGEVLKEQSIRDSLENLGTQALIQTPQQAAASIKEDSDQYADILKRMNISLD